MQNCEEAEIHDSILAGMALTGSIITLSRVTERAWQQELQQFIDDRFRVLRQVPGQPDSYPALRIVPPLAHDEAKYFILGMETGLFEVDMQGAVNSPLAGSYESENGKQQGCLIFSCDPPPLCFTRTSVCLLSIAAALILEKGWLQRQIEIQPMSGGADATIPGADIVIRSIDGKLLAAVVVKRTMHELEKLRNDLHQCCKRGQHASDNCGFPQNHGIFDYCAVSKPHYLWAVAPEGEICFHLTYRDNGTIELEEFGSLPPRSIMEIRGADSA